MLRDDWKVLWGKMEGGEKGTGERGMQIHFCVC